jgi:hypothetical protein
LQINAEINDLSHLPFAMRGHAPVARQVGTNGATTSHRCSVCMGLPTRTTPRQSKADGRAWRYAQASALLCARSDRSWSGWHRRSRHTSSGDLLMSNSERWPHGHPKISGRGLSLGRSCAHCGFPLRVESAKRLIAGKKRAHILVECVRCGPRGLLRLTKAEAFDLIRRSRIRLVE